MKWTMLLLLLSVEATSCTTSRVVPDKSIILNGQTIPTAVGETSTNPVTVFLLERDIPPAIKRLGVVLIFCPAKGLKIDNSVKRELQRKCHELGANGAYRLSEGYYPNTSEIPYLVFKYEQ